MRTSITHPLRIDTLELATVPGRIGITFCPGKHQPEAWTGAWRRDLDLDLTAIKAWNATHLLTLIRTEEFRELSVDALPQKAEETGLRWHHLPITDGSVPDAAFETGWRQTGVLLQRALVEGHDVVVHCKGGLGRAGTIAARLLLELGECATADDAMARVRRVRRHAIDPGAQEAYLRAIADRCDRDRGALD